MLLSGMVPMPVKCWIRHFRNWKVNDSNKHVKPRGPFSRAEEARAHKGDVSVLTVLHNRR